MDIDAEIKKNFFRKKVRSERFKVMLRMMKFKDPIAILNCEYNLSVEIVQHFWYRF